MKILFLKIDFWSQTLLLLLALFLLPFCCFHGGGARFAMSGLLAIIGIWQLSSSIIHSLFSNFSFRKYHLIISILTLIAFYLGLINSSIPLSFATGRVLAIPGGIAIWYYKMTFDEFFSKKTPPNSSEN